MPSPVDAQTRQIMSSPQVPPPTPFRCHFVVAYWPSSEIDHLFTEGRCCGEPARFVPPDHDLRETRLCAEHYRLWVYEPATVFTCQFNIKRDFSSVSFCTKSDDERCCKKEAHYQVDERDSEYPWDTYICEEHMEEYVAHVDNGPSPSKK